MDVFPTFSGQGGFGFPIFVDFLSILNIFMKRLLGIMVVSLMLSIKEDQNTFWSVIDSLVMSKWYTDLRSSIIFTKRY